MIKKLSDFSRKYADVTVRWLIGMVALVFIGGFCVIAVWHLRYPYEIEWYEGLMMDHILRVVHGLPIFAKPDVYFSAALYQPLYYYLVAPLISLTGPSFLAGRIVTVLATSLTAVVIGLAVARLTNKSKFAILVSLGLLFSVYGLTDDVQTVVRIDSLYVFFVLSALYVVSFRTYSSSILTAVLLAAAYFTKQEAMFFLPLPLLWLFASDKGKSFVCAGVLACLIAIFSVVLQHVSNGWYYYYVYAMPKAKGQYYGYLRVLAAFPTEMLKYWGVGLLLIGIFITMIRSREFKLRSVEGLWGLAVLSAIIQACMHRGDQMSGNNVLYPFSAIFAVFFSYAVWCARNERHALAPIFEWGLLIQLVVFIFDPRSQPNMFPGAKDREAGDNFIRYLRSIPGDVVIPAHGFLGTLAGKQTHTHCQVENDVIVMRDSIAADYRRLWQQAYDLHRFGAIIWDISPWHKPDSIPGYTLVGQLPSNMQVGSKMGPDIVKPTYLYLPIAPGEQSTLPH